MFKLGPPKEKEKNTYFWLKINLEGHISLYAQRGKHVKIVLTITPKGLRRYLDVGFESKGGYCVDRGTNKIALDE